MATDDAQLTEQALVVAATVKRAMEEPDEEAWQLHKLQVKYEVDKLLKLMEEDNG